jgi:hypothetical protein
LAKISGEGNHFATIFDFQPFQDDRGIKPAGIGEDNFFRGRHLAFSEISFYMLAILEFFAPIKV